MAKLIEFENHFFVSTKVVHFFIENETMLVIWLDGGAVIKLDCQTKEHCKKNLDALADLMRADIGYEQLKRIAGL
jgi:hypothetical protein